MPAQRAVLLFQAAIQSTVPMASLQERYSQQSSHQLVRTLLILRSWFMMVLLSLRLVVVGVVILSEAVVVGCRMGGARR